MLDLPLAHSQSSCSGMYVCQDLKEEHAHALAESPTFVYMPEKVQVTVSSKVTLLSLALTAPNWLNFPSPRFRTSTRLGSCTSLHPSPVACEFLLWVSSCQPPRCRDCLGPNPGWKGRELGFFSSPHPSIPSPNKYPRKMAVGGVSEAP